MATYRTFAHVLNNALGMYSKRKDRELYNIGRRDIGRYIDVIISTDLNADKRPAMAEITHDSTGQQEKKKGRIETFFFDSFFFYNKNSKEKNNKNKFIFFFGGW